MNVRLYTQFKLDEENPQKLLQINGVRFQQHNLKVAVNNDYLPLG